MRQILSEHAALERLNAITSNFRSEISNYERRAKSCLTCDAQGSCCVDAHFVNVRITRLEAVAIKNALERMPVERSEVVKRRIDDAIEDYSLSCDSDTFAQSFACPLFEKGVGCIVHSEAKPLACIAHACYENREDLPPDALLSEQEMRVQRLERQTYLSPQAWLPIPVAIKRVSSASAPEPAAQDRHRK